MGVLTESWRQTPGDAPTSTDGDSGGTVPEQLPVAAPPSPFLQNYDTEDFEVDSQTINEMLSATIAVANLM